MKIAKNGACWRSKTQSERRCKAVAAIFSYVSSSNIPNVSHCIQTKRSARAKRRYRDVQVYRSPAGVIRSKFEITWNKLAQSRRLAGLIHHAAGRTSSEQYWRWPLEHLH